MNGSAKFRSRERESTSIVILPPSDTGDGYGLHWRICVSVYLVFLFFAYLFVYLFIYLCVYLFICLFCHLFVIICL